VSSSTAGHRGELAGLLVVELELAVVGCHPSMATGIASPPALVNIR